MFCLIFFFMLGDDSPLSIYEPLIGKTWLADFPGGKATDTQVFEWILEKKFLRNRHWVKNSEGQIVYEGEAIFGVDPATKNLVWWYWNTTGGYIVGTTEKHGNSLVSIGNNHAPPGQPPETKGEIIISEGQWISIQYFKKDGVWQKQFEMVFKVKEE